MPQIDAKEVKEKILSTLKIRGPCLPVQVSREIKLDTLFASAFLSQLSSEGEIRISNLKVGGSPLYFLKGQEIMLENFYNRLPGKEREAFLLLKEKRLLEDEKQEPAIRVALRSIKDFAFPLAVNLPNIQKLFWRHLSLNEEEAKKQIEEIIEKGQKKSAERLEEKKPVEKIKEKQETKEEQKEIKRERFKEKEEEKRTEKEKPLIAIKLEKPKKPVEKSDFIKKALVFLETENIELLEEKEIKKKEFYALIRTDSNLGKVYFYFIAKDKKTITENDLALSLQKSQEIKMPLFLVSSGSLDKKAREYAEANKGMIKFKQI